MATDKVRRAIKRIDDPKKSRDRSKDDDKKKNFIQKAIKRPGALTKLVGGPPSENMAKVRRIAKTGTTLQKDQANFFLNVLNKVRRPKKRKSMMGA